jgi:putative oxidoreductase
VYCDVDPWDPLEVATAVLRAAFGLMLFFLHGVPSVVEVATYLGTGETSTYLNAVVEMQMPAPFLAAALAAAALFLGGLLVAAGFLTRPSAAVLTGILCGALVQNLMSGRDPQVAGLYALVAVTFAVAGGGRYSLDAVLSGRRPRSRGLPFNDGP